MYLEIVMTGELRQAVERCTKTDIPCTYLVHTRPRRMTAKARNTKPHAFAVTREHLTKTFTKVRDESGAYQDLAPEARPTFHEIRALGVHLYQQAGFPKEYIMGLSGHATESMLDRYARDHEQQKPRRVEAGLPSIAPPRAPSI